MSMIGNSHSNPIRIHEIIMDDIGYDSRKIKVEWERIIDRPMEKAARGV